MKKILLCVVVLVAGITAKGQIMVQGFNEETTPTGWAIETVANVGTITPTITFETSSTFPSGASPTEGQRLVRFNSWSADAGDKMRLKTSSSFSTVNFTSINVTFSWYNDDEKSTSNDQVTVQWSTDGTTWTDATSYSRYNATEQWTSKSCALPAGAQGQANLYIAFVFTSAYGNDCHLDNVQVTGTFSGSPNSTSDVKAPGTQIAAATLASTATSSGSAVSVFKFTIEDKNAGADGYATNVHTFKIKKSSGTADWTDHIAGAQLYDGTGTLIPNTTAYITDNDITITKTSGSFSIAHGATQDVTLKIWLNTTNIVDGATMVFQVPTTSHGFDALSGGSDFASTVTGCTGNTITIGVTATKLAFTTQPSPSVWITTNLATAPVVKAQDANGNTDINFTSTVTISNSGSVGMTGNSLAAVAGVATFTNLQFTAAGLVSLTASATGVTTSSASNDVEIFAKITSFPYYENFEEGWGQWKEDGDAGTYDWGRITGAPPSTTATGPYGAYSGNYYMYTEADNGNQNDVAILYANFDFTTLSNPTLKFYYHRHGNGIGDLYVDVSTNDGSNWTNVYSKTGENHPNYTDSWTQASVNLASYGTNSNVRIRFRGIHGTNANDGDISIDKVEVSEEACTLKDVNGNTCSFNFESCSAGYLTSTANDCGWKMYELASSTNDWAIVTTGNITGTKSLAISTTGTSSGYTNVSGTSTVAFYATKIDATYFRNLKLDFTYKCNGESGKDFGKVVVSTNGTTWNDVNAVKFVAQGTSTVTVSDFDISTADGQQFYIGFYWENDGGNVNTPPFTVDDVKVKGTPKLIYSFSYRQDTYTPIVGTVVSGFTDYNASVSLPFTFNYAGTNYTSARVSTKGWLRFSSTSPGAASTNNIGTTAYTPFLAPLWDNLTADSYTSVIYATSGTSPNRTFTVEWRNILWGGARQNFQVKLYETTNVVEFVYGTMHTPTGGSASIGINDGTYCKSRFISVTPGTYPSSSFTISENEVDASTYLTSGITYIFSPNAMQTYYTWQPATLAIGQADLVSNVTTANASALGAVCSAVSSKGVVAVGGNSSSNRVLIWNSIPTTSDATADWVVGQPDMTTVTSGLTAAKLNLAYAVAFSPDGSKLLVADAGNHRVLIYNLDATTGRPTANGMSASIVIGQANMTSGTANRGGTAAANTLNTPTGILITPSGKMLITDHNNNRVLIFNKIPTTQAEADAGASLVIGQSSMTTSTTGTSSSKFDGPWDCAFTPDGKLLVSDNGDPASNATGNHRIMIFDGIPTANGASAVNVIGNYRFGAITASVARNRFNQPSVTVSPEGKIAVADFGNNRVLIFNETPVENNVDADIVLGQTDFDARYSFSNGYATTTTPSAYNMAAPYGINFDLNGRLLVNGNGMNRVMVFGTTPTQTADIQVSVSSDAVGTVCIGAVITFTITAKNNGPNDAYNVIVNAALPHGFSFKSSSTSSGSFNSVSGRWAIPAITNGSTVTLTFSGTVQSSIGSSTVTAYASVLASMQNDSNFNNNASSSSITVSSKNAPTITAIADQTINRNSHTIPVISFTVTDVENDVNAYSATSSNTTLIPVDYTKNIIFGGTYPNKNVDIYPQPDLYGTSDIVIKVQDVEGCYVTENFTISVGNIWQGDDSSSPTDWFTAANWSYKVPSSSVEAIVPTYPSGGYFPAISSTIGTCEDLYIEEGGSLTINSGGSLQASGNITLESTSTMDASLVDLNAGNGVSMVGSGQTVTVQRYLSGYSWHYISSPLSAINNSLYMSTYGGPYNANFVRYNEAWTNTYYNDFRDGWVFMPSNTVLNTTYPIGKGYGVFYDREVTINATGGDLNSGNYTFTVTNQNAATTLNGNLQYGWNLVGNPYSSGLDAKDFLDANASVIDNTAYFWGKSGSSGLATSDYASWNASTQLGTIGGTNVTPDKYISSGQAFFVHKTSTGSGSVSFTNSMRETENSYFYKKEEKTNPVTHFKMQVVNPAGELNEMLITFVDGATNGHEGTYDAYKVRGNTKLALYSIIGNSDYCIQGLPTLTGETTVAVGLDAGYTGTYKFWVSAKENFTPGTQIELIDNETNTVVDLTQENEYSFTIAATGNFRDRFELRFNSTPKVTTWTGAADTDWHNAQNWNFGVPTSATDALIKETANHPVVSQSAACKNLTIEPDAILSLSANQTVSVAGDLVIASGQRGSGSLVMTDNSASVNVSGSSNAQMWLNMSGRYYYVSSPVQGAQSGVFGTTDELTNSDARLYRLNTTTNNWERISDDVQTVNIMQGYAFRTAQSTPRNLFTWSGALNNGAQSISLDNGFTLVGNPYPSAIDWDLVTQTSEVSATMWYRIGGTGGSGGGGYFATYNRGLQYGVNGGQSYIPAMQAFWVEAPNGGTLQIDNAVRIAQLPSFYKQQKIKNGVVLSLSGNGANDQMALCLHPQAVDAFDVFDSRKMEQNADAVNFYSFADNKKTAINALNINIETGSVALGFVAPREGTYTIKVDELTFDAEVQAFLEDRLLQTVTPLQTSSVVEFTSQAGTFNNRFVLHLRRSATVIDNNTRNNTKVYAFQKNIYVLSEKDALVEVYDIAGKLLVSKNVNNKNNVIAMPQSGVYIVKVVNQECTETNKVLIN